MENIEPWWKTLRFLLALVIAYMGVVVYCMVHNSTSKDVRPEQRRRKSWSAFRLLADGRRSSKPAMPL